MDLKKTLTKLETVLIKTALAACLGNKLRAAQLLNIGRSVLYCKMKRLGIPL